MPWTLRIAAVLLAAWAFCPADALAQQRSSSSTSSSSSGNRSSTGSGSSSGRSSSSSSGRSGAGQGGQGGQMLRQSNAEGGFVTDLGGGQFGNPLLNNNQANNPLGGGGQGGQGGNRQRGNQRGGFGQRAFGGQGFGGQGMGGQFGRNQQNSRRTTQAVVTLDLSNFALPASAAPPPPTLATSAVTPANVPSLRGAQLSVQNGVATLSGTVGSERDARLAAAILSLEPGIRRVESQLQVSAQP